jgi:hypothetical protein
MYYTVERVHAPCGTRKAVLFRLTYRREWRPEVQQWCDVKVSEEELKPANNEEVVVEVLPLRMARPYEV